MSAHALKPDVRCLCHLSIFTRGIDAGEAGSKVPLVVQATISIRIELIPGSRRFGVNGAHAIFSWDIQMIRSSLDWYAHDAQHLQRSPSARVVVLYPIACDVTANFALEICSRLAGIRWIGLANRQFLVVRRTDLRNRQRTMGKEASVFAASVDSPVEGW